MITTWRIAFAAAALSLAGGSASAAGIRITEFLATSNVGNFEFVEFTNTGDTPIDMTGWSEDDSGATANKSGHSLSAFGILAPNESAIFTEGMPAAFRTYWGAALPASVKVVGPYSNDNLGSSADSVTLFDNTGTLVDRVDYSGASGGSANGVSRNAPLAALGQNNNSLWVNSANGDSFGSFAAAQNTALFGNPGFYTVPEPSSIVLGTLAIVALCLFARRQRVAA